MSGEALTWVERGGPDGGCVLPDDDDKALRPLLDAHRIGRDRVHVVLYALASESDRDGFGVAGFRTLARRTRLPERRVREALDVLDALRLRLPTGRTYPAPSWRLDLDLCRDPGTPGTSGGLSTPCREPGTLDRAGDRAGKRAGKRAGTPAPTRTRPRNYAHEPTPQRSTEPTGSECPGCSLDVSHRTSCPLARPEPGCTFTPAHEPPEAT